MDIKAIANDFKAFIMRGNVVDLAVGVVIGSAFGKVIEAIVGSVINPTLNLFHIPVNDPKNPADLFKAVITFVAVSAVVFFLIVKPFNYLKSLAARHVEGKPAEPPPLPDDVKLLMEIRDLLRETRGVREAQSSVAAANPPGPI
jgi:large conductance mechanosensitive channel